MMNAQQDKVLYLGTFIYCRTLVGRPERFNSRSVNNGTKYDGAIKNLYRAPTLEPALVARVDRS